MSTGKGIAIPTPKKPVQAVGKFTLALTNQQGGLHLSVHGATKEDIRYGIATGGYIMGAGIAADPEPQPEPPEPETRAKRTLSPATIAKMKAAQVKRQAELRKAKEAAAQTMPVTKARKGKTEKAMTADAG